MKTKYVVLSAVVASFMVAACGPHKSQTSDDTAGNFCIPDSLMENITLDTIKAETVMSSLNLSGKISFNEDNVVKVYPVVSGHVGEVKVSLGDFVQKGQVLATVRSSDMANYFNDYKAAQSELAIAKKNLDVTTDMKNSGVSSEKDLLTAQSEYDKALAQFNKVKEVLKIYGGGQHAADSTGSGFTVLAPISGFIVEKNINTGMELRADQQANLFTISDLKQVWATANVYETDISRIKPGNDAEVSTLSYQDKKFSGKVEKISNVLNPETNVMAVKIRLSNPDYTLKPGMFANVSILFPGSEKKMVVPSSCVLFDDNKTYVVSFRQKCDVDMEPVTIYKQVNDKTYLDADSVHVGDRVISRNNLFVFTALKKL